MRVFITGATGYIGQAVAEAFARRGHEVWALVRSREKARPLEAREIVPVLGDMRAPESYAAAAREAEVLVHCAAEYSADYQALDARTVHALLDAANRSRGPKTMIYTSGVWLYGDTAGQAAGESSAQEAYHLIPWRGEHEELVLKSSGPKLRGVVLRPGCVYGGRGGLPGLWFSGAAKDGAAVVAGDGANRWAMVHVEDLAALYALAAERRASGELFNAADGSRARVRDMAEAASRAAGAEGRIKALPRQEAEKAFGFLAKGLMLDQAVDSSKARDLLGWAPRFNGFLEAPDRFFAAWKAAQPSRTAAAAAT